MTDLRERQSLRQSAVEVAVIRGRELGSTMKFAELQCAAIAPTSGVRCRLLVEDSPRGHYDERGRYDLDRWRLPDRVLDRYQRQRCRVHVLSDAPDSVPLDIFDLGPAA
jgi:hypothetical protein